jgi:hypothetical protein
MLWNVTYQWNNTIEIHLLFLTWDELNPKSKSPM